MRLVIGIIIATAIWLPAAHKPWPVAEQVIPCTFDGYSCSSFVTQQAAQDVFNYCVEQGAGDIHNLDGDGIGRAHV